jgi:hypothetical protein
MLLKQTEKRKFCFRKTNSRMGVLFQIYAQNFRKVCLQIYKNELEVQGSDLGLIMSIYFY